MQSCIYEGTVTHSRFLPVKHRFRYRLNMLYLDLQEVPEIVGARKLISDRRFSSRSFIPSDHLFNHRALTCQIRQLIEDQTGKSSTGRIHLLTQLRYFGYYFSPLNLFYVNDSSNSQIEYVVAEVNNTPWKERHAYVLWQGNRTRPDLLRFSHPKKLHVSPFMAMDMDYHWRLSSPGDKLSVVLENHTQDSKLFSASMTLRRRELTRHHLRLMSFRYPWMTAQIIAAIHFQALKLWWKKCPVYTHPLKHASLTAPTAHKPVK